MKRQARRITLFASMALAVPLALLSIASPALAAPKGIFAKFADCPLATFRALGVSPGEAKCSFNETLGGEVAIGSTKVPINQTITLQGGAIPTGNPNEVEYFLIPGADGATFSKTELNVPGGLLDFVNCEEIKGNGILEKLERGTCKALFENKTTGVTATTESAASTKEPAILQEFNLNEEVGTAIHLPVRIHLKNPLLGSGCYIGSEASPINLELTTGKTSPKSPNKSIHGKLGAAETLEEKGQLALRIKNNSLVDNSFAVPMAEGCGGVFSFLIDPIVDGKLKLPSADGNNTAILNGTLNIATAEAVEASEKF
jgi:hypothetical protein